MKAEDLTREQLTQLAAAANRAREFYVQLVQRMDARHFSQNDPLYKLAVTTRDKTEELWIKLHYHACGLQHAGGHVPRQK